ncbi:MAG: PLP-dependent transferase [Pseudomonadota bacterium]
MKKTNAKKPETLVARIGGFIDAGSGGLVPPIQASTTFARDENYNLLQSENSYGRDNNDQVRLAEQIICALENGASSKLFASGMAAISGLISGLKRGEKLLVQKGMYWGTTDYFRKFCEHREIHLIEGDSAHTEHFTRLVREEAPAMVFIETPSNPWIRVSDIAAISKAAKEVGAFLAVDGTAATPLLMQSLSLGADVSIHSATKALNGHSDVLAGVLTCRDPDSRFWRYLIQERHGAGAILSAQSAWLLIRGLRTLHLRVAAMSENAMGIAKHLASHEKVEAVWYPGLEDHLDHRLAKEQMEGGYGYLMSFLIKGGKSEALAFCRHLEGIHRATSLGGTESLVEHRHTIEGDLTGCPENLIRLSVGIENLEDLIAELDEALGKL